MQIISQLMQRCLQIVNYIHYISESEIKG